MSKQWRVVVTDYEYNDLSLEEAVFEPIAGQVELVGAQCRTEAEVIASAHNADGLINQYAPLGRLVIESLEKCRIISRYGVGLNTVDVPAATERGIVVANVPDYCMDEVSDHALALLLSWARRVSRLDRNIRSGNWDYKVGAPIYRLRGRTLGLLAFGRIPRALAPKARAVGLRVLAYDPYIDQNIMTESGVEPCELDDLLQRSDFVSIHVPLSPATRHLISLEKLALMRPEALLINTSRGPLINEADLLTALRAGQIAGAALDVLEDEPIRPVHPLAELDNVLLTPHVAWYSVESEMEMRTKAARNVLQALLEQPVTYRVN